MVNSFSHAEYEYTFSSAYMCIVLLAEYYFWYYMYTFLKKDRCDPCEVQVRFVVGVVVILSYHQISI
jgi:hypothetical protein